MDQHRFHIQAQEENNTTDSIFTLLLGLEQSMASSSLQWSNLKTLSMLESIRMALSCHDLHCLGQKEKDNLDNIY